MAERIDDLAASFARHLRAEGKAKRTVVLYGQSIRFYCEWLAAQERDPVMDELSRAGIREWLAQLADVHVPSTVRTRFSGLRRFCNWLVAEDYLTKSPMAGMSPPSIPDKLVPILADDEISSMIKTCTGKGFVNRRDEAMIRMLIDCGLRVSELCGLRVDELDLDNEMAVVLGKGNKRRPIYFGSKTARALDRYLRERRSHKQAHADQVFIGQRGAMSPDGARERVKIRAEQAGLTDRTHPHRFRHSWAHDFLLAGGQERDLKRLAGWTSDTMLERYGASAADMRARASSRRLRRGDRI